MPAGQPANGLEEGEFSGRDLGDLVMGEVEDWKFGAEELSEVRAKL